MKTKQARLGYGIVVPFLLLMVAIGQGRGVAYADAGDLDPSFGGDGKVATDFLNGEDRANAVAIQPNGKIVVAGYTIVSQTTLRDFALTRYHPNGDLDASFDGDGKVFTHILGDVDIAYAVAIQPDGKIVAAGTAREVSTAQFSFAVVRYNPNGAQDGTFGGGDGKVTIPFAGGNFASRVMAVALQPDGKIVLGGQRYDDNYDFAMARLLPNGDIDNSFDGDGKLTTDFFGGEDRIRAVRLQPDGRIVVAGMTQVSGYNYDYALARYNPDGTLDTTFNGDGKANIDFFGGDDGAYDMAIQTDGKIVAAGGAFYEPSSYNFGVARLLPNGNPDLNFGVGGIKAENLGGIDVANGVVLQSDGKIVTAGYAWAGTQDFALARFDSNGFLDPSFSGDGFLTTNILGGEDTAEDLAIQADGKIIAVGTGHRSGFNYDFVLARYLSGLEPTPSPTPSTTPTSTFTNTPLPTQTPGGPTATPMPTSTSAATPTLCPIQFTDVPPGSTFYDFVRCLACGEVVSGYPDGTFRPGNPVTRGQLSKIVSNSAGYVDPHTEQTFEDVPVGSTFHVFVERLAVRSYISGYACGGASEPCVPPTNRPYFRPNNPVTRGQTAKIVASAAGLPAPPPGLWTFQDVPQGSTFWQWIESLSSAGAISGYPCGGEGEPCVPPENRYYFRPTNNVTRGQSAKIVAYTFFPGCQVAGSPRK